MKTRREQIKEALTDYLGSDLSKNLEQWSTPENVLLNKLVVLIEQPEEQKEDTA